jgi:DNA repair exonuclease SbcCD ATPase subunit
LGFLDRFFGKEKKEELPLSLDIKDLEHYIGAKIKARKSGACEVLLPKIDEILDAKERAKEIIEELREHDFPEDIKDRVYKPILTSKPLYVKGIFEALEEIGIKNRSFEDIQSFYDRVLNVLKAIQKVQLGQGRYVAAAFEEEVLRLGTVLNRMIDLTKEVGDSLAEENKALTLLQDLGSKSIELNIKIKEMQKSREKIAELEKEISKLETEIKALRKESAEFENSRAFQEYLKLAQSFGENRKQRAALESTALNLFGPLARVFRKYKKIAGSEIGLEPVAAVFSGQNYAALLKEVRKAVKSGALYLDAKEEERTLQKLEKAIAGAGELKSEYEKILREEVELKSKLSSSPALKRKEEMEAELKACEKKLGELNGELRSIESSAIEKRMLEIKESIQEGLSKVEGREVNIYMKSK